jgi:D-xylonolactonase
MPDPEVRVVAECACKTGEGPMWHPDERVLYWTDIPEGKLWRLDPATGVSDVVYDDRPVGGYTIQADGKLLLFRDKGNVVTWHDGAVIDTVVDQVDELVGTRFNDVFADAGGRVFCGTMAVPDGRARLYRLDPDGSLHLVGDGYGVSNGMALTPAGDAMYFNDSGGPDQKTWRFDHDPDTGELSNRTVFRDPADDAGAPDGLTVDAAGTVWTARWGGSCVIGHHAATGEPVMSVPLPAKNITCPTFAPSAGNLDGPYDTMYVTSATAGKPRDSSDSGSGPHGGDLFAITGLPAPGKPEHRSRIGL